jgi:23S rRNA-/tRNA-specific pseudouridylate synthase
MTRPPLILKVTEQAHGQRLDRFLREHIPDVSRGSLRRLIESRKVLEMAKRHAKGSSSEQNNGFTWPLAMSDRSPSLICR